MRTMMLSGLVVVGVALGGLGGLAQAANPPVVSPVQPVQPGQPPSGKMSRPTLHITGFNAAAIGSPKYTGGPLEIIVDVANDASSPQSVTLKLGVGPNVLVETATVPANSTAFHVKFKDPIGLLTSCGPRNYTIDASFESLTQYAHVTPTCTFGSSVVDPWNQVTPDHQQSLQSDSLFIWNTVVESAPSCTTGLKAKVTVRNNSKLSSPSILVHASNGGTVKAQTPAAFPIAVGQSKDVIVEPYGAQSGDPTALTLTIVDWTHSLGSHLGAQGVTITPTRSCTLAASLDDAPRQAAH